MVKKIVPKVEKMEEESKKEVVKKETKFEVDLIVPSRNVDWAFFSSNIKSWFEELPIRNLYFGCNVKDDTTITEFKEYLSQYPQVQFIDQRHLNTLGVCITDLMKRVETEWFVYVHTDVFVTPHSFLVMKAEMDNKVGIIESERVSTDYDKKYTYPTVYSHYHYIDRAFSGYQLIQKKAIESMLDKIEDDFVYRNEDIIFQNACENAGIKYIKSWAMHIHTSAPVNQKWTPQNIEVSAEEAQKQMFDMQIKGIIKYCTPTPITVPAWRDAYGACAKLNKLDLFQFIETFVRKINPQWEQAIKDCIMELLIYFVWK